MTKIRDLMDQRAQLMSQAREITDLCDRDKRTMIAEESQRYDKLVADALSLTEEIDRRTKALELEARMNEQGSGALRPDPETRDSAKGDNAEQRAAFQKFLRYQPLAEREYRALAADVDSQGGFIKPPQEFVSRLIKFVDNMLFFRQPGWATVLTLTGSDSLGEASLDNDPDDGDWTAEVPASIGMDSTMSFGKRELKPHALTKGIKVSRKLLRLTPDVEALVISRLGYKMGVTMEKAYLTGVGTNQPLGVFVASNNGISTGRDVSTGNTTTAPTFDGLIEAKYTLKGQYWPRAKWLFHRDVLKVIAKIKDGEGKYIWRESVRAGEPDTILNVPTFMSEYAPSTLTTGLYAGIIGDFSFYHIADSLSMEVQRLNELYAEQRQVGFIGTLESDGMPVLEEAFVRVKLA